MAGHCSGCWYSQGVPRAECGRCDQLQCRDLRLRRSANGNCPPSLPWVGGYLEAGDVCLLKVPDRTRMQSSQVRAILMLMVEQVVGTWLTGGILGILLGVAAPGRFTGVYARFAGGLPEDEFDSGFTLHPQARTRTGPSADRKVVFQKEPCT